MTTRKQRAPEEVVHNLGQANRLRDESCRSPQSARRATIGINAS